MKRECLLSLLVFFALTTFTQKSEAQIAIYSYGKHSEKAPKVKSYTDYRYRLDGQGMISSQISYYEVLDTSGRIIERKDWNIDGSFYAWYTETYYPTGEYKSRSCYTLDSSLVFTKQFSIDDQGRRTRGITRDEAGSIIQTNIYHYNKDSETYISFNPDSSQFNVIKSRLNVQGKKTEVIYTRDIAQVDTVFHDFYNYKDTTLTEYISRRYNDNKHDYTTRVTYDTNENALNEYRQKSGEEEYITESKTYDKEGNILVQTFYRNREITDLSRREYTYTSNHKILKEILYQEVENSIKRSPAIVDHIKNFDYDIYGNSLRIVETSQRYINEYETGQIKITAFRYDAFGNWFGTTYTSNGELQTSTSRIYKWYD